MDADGEVVFNTGMSGYPESLTDPSYRGQVLVFTYPLIGNYGVPSEERELADRSSASLGTECPSTRFARSGQPSQSEGWGFSRNFESENVHVRGVIVTQVSEDYSHHTAVSSLHRWLEHHGIPGITGIDTRALTKKLREHGVMLGALSPHLPPPEGRGGLDIEDPNNSNLVAEVSCKDMETYEPVEQDIGKKVIAYDCGMKRNIFRSFLKRGVTVVRVPWDFDLDRYDLPYDGVFISNGPGDPKMCQETITQIQKSINKGSPTFGICLGNQLLSLAIGGDTFKLKYGHRGVNQPCVEHDENGNATDRCIITSQNHGYAVSEELPADWKPWFRNANDGTVEGVRHSSGKFFAVQFHPEATPGPEDANYLFDKFVEVL